MMHACCLCAVSMKVVELIMVHACMIMGDLNQEWYDFIYDFPYLGAFISEFFKNCKADDWKHREVEVEKKMAELCLQQADAESLSTMECARHKATHHNNTINEYAKYILS